MDNKITGHSASRKERFLNMKEQILELYDVKAEHGLPFLKDLIYPIEDHVLQVGLLYLTRELDPELIALSMQAIKGERDMAFVQFVTTGIVALRSGRRRKFIENELDAEIARLFDED